MLFRHSDPEEFSAALFNSLVRVGVGEDISLIGVKTPEFELTLRVRCFVASEYLDDTVTLVMSVELRRGPDVFLI